MLCGLTLAGILSDPDKRRRYDQGGFSNLQPSDLEVQVDLSSLGVVNTAVAAFFNKLGEASYTDSVCSLDTHYAISGLHGSQDSTTYSSPFLGKLHVQSKCTLPGLPWIAIIYLTFVLYVCRCSH